MSIETEAREAAAAWFAWLDDSGCKREHLEDAYVDGYRRAIADIAEALTND